MKKFKQRSKLRKLLGQFFYFLKKQIYWNFSGTDFAQTLSAESLPYEIFSDQSLLLRPLKGLDMNLQHNKVKNLSIAIQKLDGLLIKPGETFSYWKSIGNPTLRKGYLPGMILINGKIGSGIGGGLCQLSNLIYWLALHSPLTVVERWRHSFDVFPDVGRDRPFGSGATCAYPNIDLQLRNDTQSPYQLRLWLTKTHLCGAWRSNQPLTVGYRIEERHHEIKHEWWGGYTRNNQIFRIVYDLKTGQKLDEQLVAENHAMMMYEPLIEA